MDGYGFEIQAEAEEKEKKEINKRLDEIEKDLRRMQKEWIDMYEKVNKLLHL